MTHKLRLFARLVALSAVLLVSAPARAGVISIEADPFIDFSFTALNPTENPQLFVFTFTLPYVDGAYDTLLARFSSTITDSDSSGGAAAVPGHVSGFTMVPFIDGADILGAALGGGCLPLGAPGFAVPCDVLASASVGVSTLASGTFGAVVSFTLSGGDSISGVGHVELSKTAVPEPVTLSLLGLGVGIAAVRRRPWRRSA